MNLSLGSRNGAEKKLLENYRVRVLLYVQQHDLPCPLRRPRRQTKADLRRCTSSRVGTTYARGAARSPMIARDTKPVEVA